MSTKPNLYHIKEEYDNLDDSSKAFLLELFIKIFEPSDLKQSVVQNIYNCTTLQEVIDNKETKSLEKTYDTQVSRLIKIPHFIDFYTAPNTIILYLWFKGGIITRNQRRYQMKDGWIYITCGRAKGLRNLVTSEKLQEILIYPYDHPHISSSGRMCMGDNAYITNEMIKNKNILSLYRYLAIWSKRYNSRDAYETIESITSTELTEYQYHFVQLPDYYGNKRFKTFNDLIIQLLYDGNIKVADKLLDGDPDKISQNAGLISKKIAKEGGIVNSQTVSYPMRYTKYLDTQDIKDCLLYQPDITDSNELLIIATKTKDRIHEIAQKTEYTSHIFNLPHSIKSSTIIERVMNYQRYEEYLDIKDLKKISDNEERLNNITYILYYALGYATIMELIKEIEDYFNILSKIDKEITNNKDSESGIITIKTPKENYDSMIIMSDYQYAKTEFAMKPMKGIIELEEQLIKQIKKTTEKEYDSITARKYSFSFDKNKTFFDNFRECIQKGRVPTTYDAFKGMEWASIICNIRYYYRTSENILHYNATNLQKCINTWDSSKEKRSMPKRKHSMPKEKLEELKQEYKKYKKALKKFDTP